MKLFKMSLTSQMAIATVLGILVGIFFGDFCSIFAPYAAAYVMILKITAIPYVIFAILHGIGQLAVATAKEILKKGIFFIFLAWGINITMILLINCIFPKGNTSFHFSSWSSLHPVSLNFSELLIPENIFYDLANNIIPPIVIFSLLFGLALMHMREKSSIMQMLETTVNVFSKITGWIARITPIGTFLLMANQVGTTQLTTIKQMITYIILYILGVSLIIFWIFPRIVSALTDIKTTQWIRNLLPILLLGYTTNVVIVCIPYMIELIRQKVHFSGPKKEETLGQIQGLVAILFNLPIGSLFISIFILFVASFYGYSFHLTEYVQMFIMTFLTGLGSVGLGALINSLGFILDSLRLPVDSVNLFLTAVPITAGFQTMVSVMEITSLALLITFSAHRLLQIRLKSIAYATTLICLPIALIFVGLKIYQPLPEITNTEKTVCDFQIENMGKAAILKEQIGSRSLKTSLFQSIKESGVLRVGYHPNVMPFSFFNDQDELVGYDIAFANALAEGLNCKLELIPLTYQNLSDELDKGVYDIGMSAISMTEKRLQTILFSTPYIESPYVLVVNKKKKKRYARLIENEDPKLKIAVVKGTAFEALARKLFPEARIIAISQYEDFPPSKAHFLLWSRDEAITWLIRHPNFTVFLPNRTLGNDILAYAMKQNELEWHNYINLWLKLKEEEGFTKREYEKWILGKEDQKNHSIPRWSILRNVLHWEEE